jgi:hypothetical protein
MYHPGICGVCENEMNETSVDSPVCNECMDVLEFGYPSFPAFKLAESDGINNYTEAKKLEV